MEIIWAIIGGIISASIVLSIAFYRRPKLELRIIEPVEVKYKKRPANEATFLLLMVENKQLPRRLQWLDRNTAFHCYGQISFYNFDGKNIFKRPMMARWSLSPEPLPITGYISHPETNWIQSKIEILDPDRLSPMLYVDIYPGETQLLDVAVHFDKDAECYGWCNSNYYSEPQWRAPQLKLELEQCVVRVNITSANGGCSNIFRLVNDITKNIFQLEEIERSQKKQLLDKIIKEKA